MLEEFRSVAQKLQLDFEASARITHNLSKGENREGAIVREFLRPYLPKRFAVSRGLIVDSAGHMSAQQDIVIYDDFMCPVLQDSDQNKLFFVEQVAVVLEVKSVLNSAAIQDICTKGQSISSLCPARQAAQLAPGLTMLPDSSLPSIFAIAYTSSMDLASACVALNEAAHSRPNSRAPSAILVLDRTKGGAGILVQVAAEDLHAMLPAPDVDYRYAALETTCQ